MKKYYEPLKVKEAVGLEPIPDEVRIAYLRPGELLSILESFPVAYQPIGTLEWHGRQNPLGCDTIKSEALCVEAAKKTGGVVMPPLYFSTDGYRDVGNGLGCGMDSNAGFQLPGSFYKIDNATLKDLLIQACTNYLSRGFKLVVLVSGHNPRMQQYLMNEVSYAMKTDEGKEPVCFTMEYMVLEEGHPRKYTDHAGQYETSMMLLLAEDRVNMKANDGKEIEELGIMTDRPLKEASKEEGQICFELQVEGLAKMAQEKLRNVL